MIGHRFIILLYALGFCSIAVGQDLSGQAFLVTDKLQDNFCEVDAGCDCCAADLIFMTSRTFAMISRCLYDDSYFTGTYSKKDNKIILTFRQVAVNDTYDENSKKSKVELKKLKIQPMEFNLTPCGQGRIRLENSTIKEYKFGTRRPLKDEADLIKKVKGSKQWKMLTEL